jgi:hypothetical protein
LTIRFIGDGIYLRSGLLQADQEIRKSYSVLAEIRRSVNDVRFHIRIIFKDHVIAGSNLRGIFDRAAQLKSDIVLTSPANREPLAVQQSSFMHQTVRVMDNPVNSTFRHYITRTIFISHNGSLIRFRFARVREPP